jgi:2-methylaconitate cis-trans-isomerase PrpF
MKQQYSSKTLPIFPQKNPSATPDLSYIFAKPKADNKSVKEQRICEALNGVGIFQINLGVLLNDYKTSNGF